MGRAIFISYRRDDSEGEAGRLFDDLARTFGENSVFMDVTDIKPGFDFRKAIDDNVATCGVLLAMIGPTWATITGNSGERRLDDPSDFVRLEIASALAREIAVIPVLVHGAQMPHPDQLPENLKDFAFRNSVELTHVRWNTDVQLLINALRQYVASPGKTSDEPVHATVTVQLPPANPPVHEPAPTKPSRKPLFMGIAIGAALVIIAIVAVIVAINRSDSSHDNSSGASATQSVSTEPSNPPQQGSSSKAANDSAPDDADNPLVGTWTNPSKVGLYAFDRLQITANNNELSIHAWATCGTEDCDWGTRTAEMDGDSAEAVWNLQRKDHGEVITRVATVTVRPDGSRLSVTIANKYSDNRSNEHQFEFDRAQ